MNFRDNWILLLKWLEMIKRPKITPEVSKRCWITDWKTTPRSLSATAWEHWLVLPLRKAKRWIPFTGYPRGKPAMTGGQLCGAQSGHTRWLQVGVRDCHGLVGMLYHRPGQHLLGSEFTQVPCTLTMASIWFQEATGENNQASNDLCRGCTQEPLDQSWKWWGKDVVVNLIQASVAHTFKHCSRQWPGCVLSW